MTQYLNARSLAACCLVACVGAGCTSGTTGTGQTQPAVAQSAQDARLLSDAVLVLPAHEAMLEPASGSISLDSAAVLRAAFDAELKRVLEPHVAAGWMWADDLRALHRRNPLTLPDPARLATRDLRAGRIATEQILNQDLGSQLRALLAVAGARRYAILPVRLQASSASQGVYSGGVTLLVIDTRRSMIVQVRSVTLPAGEQATAATVPIGDVVRSIAGHARLELTGPDTQ